MLARNNRGIVTIRVVTRTATLIEQLRKLVSAGRNSRNNSRAVFSVRSVPKGYKKEIEDGLCQLSFKTPACQEELNWDIRITECRSVENESLWRWQSNDFEEMARKELDCAKTTSCVLQWEWYFYKSVARIWLVKTENLVCVCVCVTANCKVCKSSIAL
jgi:hypothetical protein